jgi:hypothetical protein
MLSLRKHRFIWILIAALAVLAVFLTMAYSSMSHFRRYTSKPLPDGSRFTFLYPAYLTDTHEGPGGSPEVIWSAGAHNRSGEHSSDVTRTAWGAFLRRAGLSQADEVSVVVIQLKEKSIKDSRSSEEWVRGWERRHNEYLVDSRSKLKLQLYYSCAQDAGQFRWHSRIISDSLQLLPPEKTQAGQ